MRRISSHFERRFTTMKTAAHENNKACILISSDDCDGAIELLNKALFDLFDANSNSSRNNTCSADTPSCLPFPVNDEERYQSHYYPDKSFDEGMITFALPLQIREEYDGCGHRAATKATIFFNLGIAHSRRGEELKAQACLHKSFAIQHGRIAFGTDTYENNQSIHGPSLFLILHNIGHSCWRCGRYANAVSAYESALELLSHYRHRDKHHRLDMSTTLNCIAVTKFYSIVAEEDAGRIASGTDGILAILTNALTIRLSLQVTTNSSSSNVFDRETATIMNNIGRVKFCRGELSAALIAYRKAYEYRLSALGENHIDVAASLFNIAQTEEYRGNALEAIQLYKQFLIIALSHHALGKGSKEVAKALLNIAQLSYGRDDMDQAYDFLSHALPATKLAYGPTHCTVAKILNKMGNVLCVQGKTDRALEAYQSGLALERVLYPPLHKNIAVTLSNVGRIHQRQKEWDRALDHYSEAIVIMRHNHCPKATADILFDMGVTFEMKNAFHLAEQALAEAVELYRKKCVHISECQRADDGSDDILLASALNTLGLVQSKGGSPRRALSSFMEAINILRQLSKIRSPSHDLISICFNAGKIYESIGETEKSLELYKDMLRSELRSMRSASREEERSTGANRITTTTTALLSPQRQKDIALLCYHIGKLLVNKRQDLSDALYYLDLSSKICLKYSKAIGGACASNMLTSLGDLYFQMGNRANAMVCYAEAAYALLCVTNPPAAAAA